ncbi:MAG: M23 family metallopeptidase [Methylovulum sp.]|nr:M23 family metallopeptidase [Methylovulum sp.]
MKNKFYASLLIGVGLAIASASSHAKPSHSPAKKQVSATVKHSKKQAATSAKRGKSHAHNTLATHLKSIKKKHANKITSKLANTHKRKPYKLEKLATRRLETTLPAPVSSLGATRIPHLPSRNRLVQPEVQLTENNSRIHSLISAEHNDIIHDSARIEKSRGNAPHHYSTAHGTITSSLSAAGQNAGLSDDLVTQLTNIFAWDIDFATNLHRGDQFTIVYGQGTDGNEQIIAAEFVAQGRILTAVKYEDDDGNLNYYTPEGKAMRKAFLSTPVDYVRISSHFDANRRHPILNRIRAHKGVDYAARTGTPVKATGDGNIAFIGRKGGYGQVMIIKHGEHYETLYAHLSGFKKDLQDGDTVSQGEVIGYVGQTGLATGPHLHYEFRVDGMHRNPELQAPRHLMTLNGGLLADFKTQAHPVLAQLYSAKAQTLLAKNQHSMD